MNHQNLIAERDSIEADVKFYSDALGAFPRTANGLTPDAIKQSDAYRTFKAGYNRALSKLRAFNAKHAKELRSMKTITQNPAHSPAKNAEAFLAKNYINPFCPVPSIAQSQSGQPHLARAACARVPAIAQG